MYMRASGASELRKYLNFHILKLLFLSIFCWYFRYFVVTNYMFVRLHACNDKIQMYRQNSEISLWGHCPPLLATLVHFSHCHYRFDTYLYHCSLCCKRLASANWMQVAFDNLLYGNNTIQGGPKITERHTAGNNCK